MLLASMTTDGPTTHLVLSFPHNRHATDVALSFEGTDTMQTWQPAVAEGPRNARLSIAAESAKRLFRFQRIGD